MKIKLLKVSIIISLLSAYIFTGKTEDGFALQYGYPIHFFTLFILRNEIVWNTCHFIPCGFLISKNGKWMPLHTMSYE